MKKLSYYFSILLFIAFLNHCVYAENLEGKDPEGLRFVQDILKFKGQRHNKIKCTNDAEQLLISAIENIKRGYYESAFSDAKEAVAKDPTYLKAHFILAALYENKGNITEMEKEYRYYLKKSHLMRKIIEEMSKTPDKEFEFIKNKFDKYSIPLKEPTVRDVNAKYYMIGGICVALCILPIIYILFKS